MVGSMIMGQVPGLRTGIRNKWRVLLGFQNIWTVRTVIQYIHFFFYNAFNWNIWLAFFRVYDDIRGALKYKLRRSFPPILLRNLTLVNADMTKSSPYEAVSYYMLEKLLFTLQKKSAESSIVDLGCGKGRVMVVAAHLGFKRITGIDFAKELCAEAIRNMETAQHRVPGIEWQVIYANVLDYSIKPDDSVFFMFNPFVEETLNLFLDGLEKSCKLAPRITWFLYASPIHVIALQNRGYKTIYRQKLINMEGAILCKG